MNKSTTETPINTTYAVLSFTDLFGTGYLVHQASHVAAAIADGWDVIASGLTRADADNICRIYKTAGQPESNVAPVLSDLLVYDFCETVETRSGYKAQEFDLVNVFLNGIWNEYTITYFDEDTVELDGFVEISRQYAKANMELIAKAEENDFLIDYIEFLQSEQEKWDSLVQLAINASSTVAA